MNEAVERIPVYKRSGPDDGVHQGELFSGVIQVHSAIVAGQLAERSAEERAHPFAVLLTQECELVTFLRNRADGKPRDTVPSLLFLEAATAAELNRVGKAHGEITSKGWERIKINKDERYQFLEGCPTDLDAQGEGVPELGMDFRRVFTVRTDEFLIRLSSGETKRRCRLTSPYAEHLSDRFCYFMARIGLPRDHSSEREGPS